MDLMTGGIALAKVVLVVFSVVSVAAMIERIIQLIRASRAENSAFEHLRAAAAKGDILSARKTATGSASPTARALLSGLGTFPAGRERFREAVGRGVTEQTARLQDNLPYLATVASTAPYIGLFGTVIGILQAFRQIAATGETGPAVVSGSISEALITTALGLAVAIPAAIAYNLLLARVNALSITVENHTLEIADAFSDHAPEEVRA